jgi:hypothetical protein
LRGGVNDGDAEQRVSGNLDAAAPNFGRRVIEWFWRGRAIGEWQRSRQRSGDLSSEFAARSALGADLARVAITAAEPFAESVACELHRQSVYWALYALLPASHTPPRYSDSVWASLDDELLAPLAASDEERAKLRARLGANDFVALATLPASELATCCAAFDGLNAALLARWAERNRGLARLRKQRFVRLGGLLACLLALLVCMTMARARAARATDLAFEAEWRASSSYGGGGCSSPEQECDNGINWFFHTAEKDSEPWIEFDLRSVKAFSTVVIENRDDCCAERAVPLVIEVGDEQKQWRSVAKQDQQFTTWRAAFPTVRARWLRLRVLDRGPFHLKRVHIFP